MCWATCPGQVEQPQRATCGRHDEQAVNTDIGLGRPSSGPAHGTRNARVSFRRASPILNSFWDGPHCVMRLTKSEIARAPGPTLAGEGRHAAGACIGAIPPGGKEAGFAHGRAISRGCTMGVCFPACLAHLHGSRAAINLPW